MRRSAAEYIRAINAAKSRAKASSVRKLADNVEDVDENPVYGEHSELYVATEVQDTCDCYSST